MFISSNKFKELIFIKYIYVQFTGFFELGARLGPHHYIACFPAYGTAHRTTELLDTGFRFISGESLKFASNYKLIAFKRQVFAAD